MFKGLPLLRWSWQVVAGLLVAICLYVGSYGPANSLVARGYLSARKVDAAYRILPDKVVDVIIIAWRKIDTRRGVFQRD